MSYDGLKHQDFKHKVIDHAEKYVDGQVHTNGLENFWSLFKRGLKGTYVSCRTVPSVSVSGRTGVPLQQPENWQTMDFDSSTLPLTFSESASLMPKSLSKVGASANN